MDTDELRRKGAACIIERVPTWAGCSREELNRYLAALRQLMADMILQRQRALEAAAKAAGAAAAAKLRVTARLLQVDLLVVGSFGRKGERVDMLGTVSDYSLRQGHSSVAIVRSSASKAAAGSHHYMFATDGSKAAALAFCSLCHQIMKPGDQVLLISCGYDTEGATELFQKYKELAARLNVRFAELETVQ
eukprot:gene6774-6991_t